MSELNYQFTREVILKMLYLPLAFLFFTPCIYSIDIAYGIMSTKFFWLFFCSVSLLPAFVTNMFTNKTKYTLLDSLVIVFLMYIVCQAILLNVPFTNNKFLYFLCSGLVYFLIKQLLTLSHSHSDFAIKAVLILIFFCVLITCVFAILQKLTLFPSFSTDFVLTSTFFNPAPFAGFIAFVFPLALWFWWCLRTMKTADRSILFLKWASIFILTIIIFIIPSTGSRAAVLGMVLSSTYLFYGDVKAHFSSRLFKMRPVTKVIAFTGTAFLVIICIFFLYEVRTESVDGRILAWKLALNLLDEKLLFGHGIDSFQFQYPLKQIEFFKSGFANRQQVLLSYEVKRAFNEPLQILIELGLVGSVLLWIIVVFALRRTHEITELYNPNFLSHLLCAGAKGSLVAFVVFAMFSYPFSLPELTLYFFIFLAFIDLPNKAIHKKGFTRNFTILFVTMGFFIVIFYYNHVAHTLSAYKKWNKGYEQMTYLKNYKKANSVYNEIYPILKKDELFLSSYGLNLSKLEFYDKSTKVLNSKRGKSYNDLMIIANNQFKARRFKLAEASYWEAYHLLPHKFYPLYHLMIIYNQTNRRRDVFKIAQTILAKDVKINSYEIQFIKSQANLFQRGEIGKNF